MGSDPAHATNWLALSAYGNVVEYGAKALQLQGKEEDVATLTHAFIPQYLYNVGDL